MRKLTNLQPPKEFLIAGLTSILLGLLPFAIYAVERWSGSLPTEEAWFAQGVNHGPWRWEAEGFTILYPLLLLALITILVTGFRAVSRRRWRLVVAGLGLLVLQVSMMAVQLSVLFWLVD